MSRTVTKLTANRYVVQDDGDTVGFVDRHPDGWQILVRAFNRRRIPGVQRGPVYRTLREALAVARRS